MAEYLIKDTTLTEIADAIRAKTGTSDTIATTDFAEAISGIQSGGVENLDGVIEQQSELIEELETVVSNKIGGSGESSPNSYTVTFMNGDDLLCTQRVIEGDDCADVVQIGLIETPTKESTERHEFVFLGWSLINGGRVHNEALLDIVGDKVVYATYEETTRYYIITFYDGDRVIKTEIHEYGSMPECSPEKIGHTFIGWQPSIETVTGQASYYATWQELPIASSGMCGDNVSWKLYETGELSIYGSGNMADFASATDQPWNAYASSINAVGIDAGVTSVSNRAFNGCTNLVSVNLPDGLTSIGDSAFNGCTNLVSVNLPEGVTNIGTYAFNKCSNLESIQIPDSVTVINASVFRDCAKIGSINIHDGITSIGNMSFAGCNSVKSFTIPGSVTSIDVYAFSYCTSLESITIEEGVTKLPNVFAYYSSALKDVNIPASVTAIGRNAFGGTALTNAVFNDTSTWYIGSSEGAKTTSISATYLADKSTAATYLKSTYAASYWTKV